MSNDEVKSKKKEKSLWKEFGSAALAVGGLAVTIMAANKKKN